MVALIKDILMLQAASQNVVIRGWVRTKRELKNFTFVEVNDGSSLTGIQCIFDHSLPELSTGASVEIHGTLIASPASGQALEVSAQSLNIIGASDPASYPLQKKRHSFEFLREIAHLRAPPNTFGAVARLRSTLAFAVHQFFHQNGFQYVHTPIITASDAEGAGALFQVTTLDIEKAALSTSAPDYSNDFFGKKSFLTVSGQLEAETYATALSRVYTFGPTFRAENSNTTRHLAEFWMIEPEIAFADLNDLMTLAEDFLKFIFSTVMKDCEEDLHFFDAHIQKGIYGSLQAVLDSRFTHITYGEALIELKKARGSFEFEFKPEWGCDLQTEHERFLTEKVAGRPVIITIITKKVH